MPFFKIIHMLRDRSTGNGWSEVYYTNAANYDQALASSLAVANGRVWALAPDNILEYHRVTGNQPLDTTPRTRQPRASALERISLEGTASRAPEDSDLPWSAVKVRWVAGDISKFRVQLVRGVPDSWFDQGQDKVASGQFKLWINRMLRIFTLQQIMIRHLAPIVPPAVQRNYEFVQIANGIYEGYTFRATGRPFGLQRGRASKRT
jgi:hypothetical protein